MRPFHGDLTCLTGLRLRQLLLFLRHRNLIDTAYALEQETGVSFMAVYLRMLMSARRWADAEKYVLGFVDLRDCSRLAGVILLGLQVFGVMDKIAFRKAVSSTVAGSFQRALAAMVDYPEFQSIRPTFLVMRSDDRAEASRLLFWAGMPTAMRTFMNLAAECPELKARKRAPPRWPLKINRNYIVSFGPGFWERKKSHSQKNRTGRRIPSHVLARLFMRKSQREFTH